MSKLEQSKVSEWAKLNDARPKGQPAQENRGPAFDAENASNSVNTVEHEISAKSGTKALTPEQRHKAQIKRSGAGHEKKQTANTIEKDRIARYADACRRNGQTPDTSELTPSGQATKKPDYL